MKQVHINPWSWQNQLGYAQAVEIPHGSYTLYCAGQAAMDANGQPVETDMADQIRLSLDNLETVLTQAGYSLANVVRLNMFTTSTEQFFAAYGQVVGRLKEANCLPSSTLTEVKALAFPQLMIEFEATAVR